MLPDWVPVDPLVLEKSGETVSVLPLTQYGTWVTVPSDAVFVMTSPLIVYVPVSVVAELENVPWHEQPPPLDAVHVAVGSTT
jgi:hypothetical protein